METGQALGIALFMVHAAQDSQGNRRRKLLAQFFALAVIVLLIYLKPKVEAWVERQSSGTSSTDLAEASDSGNNTRSESADSTAPSNPTGSVDSENSSPIDPGSSDKKDEKASPAKSESTSKRKTKKSSEPSTKSAKPSSESASSKSESNVAGTSPKSTSTSPEKPMTQTPAGTVSTDAGVAKAGSGDKAVASDSGKKSASESSKDSTTKSKPPATAKKSGTEKSSSGSSITKMDRSNSQPKQVPGDPEKSIPPPKTKPKSEELELGKLKEIRNNVFESTAGLIYRSGSEDGHRLKHVMQHAKDNPEKPKHGVFDGDGDRDIVLAVIDEAFLKAKKGGPDVRSENQNDRLVYTVNLKRRIGHSGGQEGERKGFPECRYLRIVLEDDNVVISAFPTRSF